MRKTHIPRRSIVAGEVINGFKVVRQVPSVCGKRMVEVKCAACPDGIGTCRFTELCDGTVKSCRCLSKLAFTTNQTAFAEALTKDQASQIFTDIHLGLDKFAIKAKHNVRSSYTVDFVKRLVYARLEAIPAATRTEIYELAQISVDAAMWKFKMTKAEVMTVCTIQRQQATAATAAASVEDAIPVDRSVWNATCPDLRDEIKLARVRTSDAVGAICGWDATSPIQDEDLILPSDLQYVTKLVEVLELLPAHTHDLFDGLSIKATSIIKKSKQRNFEIMRQGMIARAAVKPRGRRRSNVKGNFDMRCKPFESRFTASELVQGFNLLREANIAA
jgi:hypothetical protein